MPLVSTLCEKAAQELNLIMPGENLQPNDGAWLLGKLDVSTFTTCECSSGMASLQNSQASPARGFGAGRKKRCSFDSGPALGWPVTKSTSSGNLK